MRSLSVLLFLLTVSSVSQGQSYQFRATFGEETMTSGFEPDPYTVEIDAGGFIDAEDLGYSCFGMMIPQES